MVFVIIGFALIALIDLPPLIRKGQRREFVTFCILYPVVFAITFLWSAGVKLPSPVAVISDFMKDTLHLYYRK